MGNYNKFINKYKPFIMTVDTTLTGGTGSAINEFKLPFKFGYDYRCIVDWGDGSSDNITLYNQSETTHTYSSGGIYTIKISGRCDKLSFGDIGDKLKIIDITQWGNIVWKDLSQGFLGCSNLSNYTASDTPILRYVTDLSSMFRDCPFNGDIGSWDVSNVTDMTQMFKSNTLFNQDIGSWDVSNITSLYSMFDGAISFNQDIGSWDTSSVDTLEYTFLNSSGFNNGGSPSISGWTTSGVTTMRSTFHGTVFNQPVGSWDTSSVESFRRMFYNNYEFNQDIGSWDMTSTSTLQGMFQNSRGFNNGGSPSISGWTTSGIDIIKGIFNGARAFNQPVGSWDVSNITDMARVFNGCLVFNQDISSWDVSNVTDMTQMFKSNTLFNQDIGSWDVSNVTDMTEMLSFCGLSVGNYDNILTGWTGWGGGVPTNTLQSNVSLGATDLNYSSDSVAEDARDYLITGITWTITDSGGI